MVTMILLMLLQTAMLVFGQVFLKLGMRDMGAWQWTWNYIWHEVVLNAWLLIGLVLLNVICALFYFIDRLVKNSDDEGKSKNSIKPFIVINSVMLVLILITFACWRFGCVEHRNNSVSAVTVSDSATPSEYN